MHLQVIDEQDHDWAERHPLHPQASTRPYTERLADNARQRDVVRASAWERLTARRTAARQVGLLKCRSSSEPMPGLSGLLVIPSSCALPEQAAVPSC